MSPERTLGRQSPETPAAVLDSEASSVSGIWRPPSVADSAIRLPVVVDCAVRSLLGTRVQPTPPKNSPSKPRKKLRKSSSESAAGHSAA